MTIIRCEYDGVIYDLDVLEETPIRVDISAIENNEIGDVFGASSQTFTLPGSRKNNRFFKHAYKVGVTNVPGLGESVRASVITNSNTLLEGSLFLDEVVRTQNDGVNYNVVITNDVVSFNESIKTVAVKDLDWTSYDHNLSVENITGSWTDNLFSGSVLYPLVDFGQDGIEGTGSVPLVEIGIDGQLGYMNNSGSAIQVQQFSPAIRVSTVLDKIFEQGGYSYSSSLQSTFDNLYILPKQTETLSVKGSGFSDYGFVAEGASAQIVPAGSTNTTIEFPTETYDPTNSFNTTTSTFTIPKAGSYVISSLIRYAFSSAFVVGSVDIRMKLNGTTTLAESLQTFGGSTTALQTVNLSTPSEEGQYLYFNQGDTITMTISYSASSPNDPNITMLNQSRFQTVLTPINYSTGTVQLGEQFEPQTKCIDILKGLIEKFNLVIEPVYTENKVLKIESYTDWSQSGNTKDWTKKVEKAKRIAIKSPLSSQPKSLIFEDSKDNDKLSKQVIDNAEGFQWGTEIIDSISDVPQGEKKVGSYFSPVVLEKIQGGGTYNVIPKLYKTDNSQIGKKTFKHKPRLGFKITGSLNTTCYIGDNAEPFTDYATISNYDSIPIVSGSTNNLHYNDSFYTPTFQATVGTKTAYENYWNYYISELYTDDNRILNLDLEFLPEEIIDIKLNDKIFVEDTVYRINKINGYNLVNPDIVNVELIKITNTLDTLNCNFEFTLEDFTTTTTTQPPSADMEIYARVLTTPTDVTFYYTLDGGPQQTLWSGTLDTNCNLRVSGLSLTPGQQMVIYTDETENIAGDTGAGATCPISVGSSTTFTKTLTSGTNIIALTVDANVPVTTTTQPVTTTTQPVTTTTQPVTTTTVPVTTTTQPVTTTTQPVTTTTVDPYNYYYMEGCPGTQFENQDRVVRTTATLTVSLNPDLADATSIFGSCFFAKSTTTKAIYDACSPSDLSCLDISGYTIVSGCSTCVGTTTTQPVTTTTQPVTTTTAPPTPGTQYGTHSLAIPGATPGNGTLVWSGFSSSGLTWVEDFTGVTNPSQNTEYVVNFASIDVYSSAGVLLDRFFANQQSTAKWVYDGQQTTVTLTAVATLSSSLGGSDNFYYNKIA